MVICVCVCLCLYTYIMGIVELQSQRARKLVETSVRVWRKKQKQKTIKYIYNYSAQFSLRVNGFPKAIIYAYTYSQRSKSATPKFPSQLHLLESCTSSVISDIQIMILLFL